MKTLRQEKIGSTTARLVARGSNYVGMLIAGGKVSVQIKGKHADEVWLQLIGKAREARPDYFGYQGARARFLEHFASGFASVAYAERERAYKLKAKALLDQTLPLDTALEGNDMGAAALKVYQATNLLSVFEKAKLAPLLRGDKGDAFIRAAARIAKGEHEAGLAAIERLAAPFECNKWTVATYLPFLWQPESCMFLKPTVTRDYASRVGHAFADDYSAQLDVSVYRSLLDLVDQTSKQMANLGPRDNIDIQSFIWIVGEYKAGDGEAELSEDQAGEGGSQISSNQEGDEGLQLSEAIRATAISNHSARLDRILSNVIAHLQSDAGSSKDDRASHIVARVGDFSRPLAADLRDRSVSVSEVATLLEQLGDIGKFAFGHWMSPTNAPSQEN